MGEISSSDAMHAYYSKRAPYYDAVYEKPERAQDVSFLRTFLPRYFENRNVLEVACGTGYWTQHLAHVAQRIVATDANEQPLAIARERVQCSNVTFCQADAYSLPSGLGRFDAAFAGLWFSHVPIESRDAFFQSFHTRLLPGAKVVLLDNNEAQLNDFPICQTDENGNTFQLRTLRDGTQHRMLKNFPDLAELNSLCARFSRDAIVRTLDNFWLLTYTLDL
jgi:ubiquinone/menaquinone biosynthesis C-methylase UbiE